MSVVTTMKAAALRLPSHRDPYYAGQWQKPKTDRYVERLAPGSGDSLGKVMAELFCDARRYGILLMQR